MINRANNNLIFFLPLIVPTLLITGPFLPDLVITLTSAIFIFKKKFLTFIKEQVEKNFFLKLFIIFIIINILGSALSDYQLSSLKSSLGQLRFLIFFLVYFFIISLNKKFILYQQQILLITLSILIFDSLFQFMFGKNILGNPMPTAFIERPTSFFGNDLKIGSYVFKISFFLLSISLYLNKNIKFCVILLILSWIVTFLSGERASFILMTLSLLFINIVFFKKIKKYLTKIFVCFFFLLIIILQTNTTSPKKLYIEKMILNPIQELGLVENSEFLPAHVPHFVTAYKIFLDNLILGSGANNFRHLCKEKKYYYKNISSCTTHPHNMYIQILAECGVLAFLIAFFTYLYFLFFYFIKKIINYFKNEDNNILLANIVISSLILINFFPFIPTGNFFNNWFCSLIFFPFGFFLYTNKRLQ